MMLDPAIAEDGLVEGPQHELTVETSRSDHSGACRWQISLTSTD
jgi:hypothetical protein